MMRPKDGIPGRRSDAGHIAADPSVVSARPAVNVVVNIFNLKLEIIELRRVIRLIGGLAVGATMRALKSGFG